MRDEACAANPATSAAAWPAGELVHGTHPTSSGSRSSDGGASVPPDTAWLWAAPDNCSRFGLPVTCARADQGKLAAEPATQRWHQLMEACGLSSLLASRGEGTLFAPTDAAFDLLRAELTVAAHTFASPGRCWLERLNADPIAAWRDILLANSIDAVMPLRKLLAPVRRRPFGQGWVDLRPCATGLRLIDAGGRQARVLAQANQAEASSSRAPMSIWSIDRVLLPPLLSLADTLRTDPRLQAFGEALAHCGLDSLLQGHGPITLFAPTNDAMGRLAARCGLRESALRAQPKRFASLLTHHIVVGRWLNADLPWGGALRTAAGTRLALSPLGLLGHGELAVPLRPSHETLARNGVIHVIDHAVLPPLP